MGAALLGQSKRKPTPQKYRVVPCDLGEAAGDLVILEGIEAIGEPIAYTKSSYLFERDLTRYHLQQLAQLHRVLCQGFRR